MNSALKVIILISTVSAMSGCGKPDQGDWLAVADTKQYLNNKCSSLLSSVDWDEVLEVVQEDIDDNVTGIAESTARKVAALKFYDDKHFSCSVSFREESPIYPSNNGHSLHGNNVYTLSYDTEYEPLTELNGEDVPPYRFKREEPGYTDRMICDYVWNHVDEVDVVEEMGFKPPSHFKTDLDISKYGSWIVERDEDSAVCQYQISTATNGRTKGIFIEFEGPSETEVDISDVYTPEEFEEVNQKLFGEATQYLTEKGCSLSRAIKNEDIREVLESNGHSTSEILYMGRSAELEGTNRCVSPRSGLAFDVFVVESGADSHYDYDYQYKNITANKKG
jgi:hypothetical protein